MAKAQTKSSGGGGSGDKSAGGVGEALQSSLKALFDSPLMREVLANALVAAAGAAAATLVKQRPGSADRVAKVGAAATSLAGSMTAEELAQAGKQALGEFAVRVGRGAVPGLLQAVSGSSSGDDDDDGEPDGAGQSGEARKKKSGGKPKTKSSAAAWK